jgi:hypothetical protein
MTEKKWVLVLRFHALFRKEGAAAAVGDLIAGQLHLA